MPKTDKILGADDPIVADAAPAESVIVIIDGNEFVQVGDIMFQL